MPELVVKYPDRSPEHFPLGRMRITLGRSASNDLCIPDPFASRVHAKVRQDGGDYYLNDLGTANGTLYNGALVTDVVMLTSGGRIQIGETEVVYFDERVSSNPLSSLVSEVNTHSLPWEQSSPSLADRTTAGVMETIWDREPVLESSDEVSNLRFHDLHHGYRRRKHGEGHESLMRPKHRPYLAAIINGLVQFGLWMVTQPFLRFLCFGECCHKNVLRGLVGHRM
jgi:pSer/pThr/pTyr-binding forkhead associated (FHA) protein